MQFYDQSCVSILNCFPGNIYFNNNNNNNKYRMKTETAIKNNNNNANPLV